MKQTTLTSRAQSEPLPQQELLQWYESHRRDLPWRVSRNPYFIWLSEVMLQQTTVAAVTPFFERFIAAFPTLPSLASAKLEDVLALWSGLGYYSRAKNLHKAAIALNQLEKFPKSHQELLELPGFGPYTSRAVSSLAFEENVGVVDGNVIRVLSRIHGLSESWWTPKGRAVFQSLADSWVAHVSSSQMNQALMELGALVCRPGRPLCNLCPLASRCRARQTNQETNFPIARPKNVATETWVWKPYLRKKNNRVALIQNEKAPFLRGEWMWPGEWKRVKTKPKKFAFRHSVTRYQIFVQPISQPLQNHSSDKLRWVRPGEIPSLTPTSLVHKTWEHLKP